VTAQDSENLTVHLRAFSGGDRRALGVVMPKLYTELRAAAARALRGRGDGATLQPTALVHEAFFRLLGQRADWQNRQHFLGVAGCIMRRIVVDAARARCAAKRGGMEERVTLDDNIIASEDRARELMAIDQALERLEVLSVRQARIVEMRYFSGLSIEETAEALGISPATVKREWMMARAFLHRELAGDA
jgi:RNA polymerase sigma factor (TIGR02999 family)